MVICVAVITVFFPTEQTISAASWMATRGAAVVLVLIAIIAGLIALDDGIATEMILWTGTRAQESRE